MLNSTGRFLRIFPSFLSLQYKYSIYAVRIHCEIWVSIFTCRLRIFNAMTFIMMINDSFLYVVVHHPA